MIPHMPPSERSASSVRRRIKDGTLRARKEKGGWAIDTKQAFADVEKWGDGAARVREFKATWELKQAALKKTRIGRKFLGAKRGPK